MTETPAAGPPLDPLVEEAIKKAAVAWVAADGPATALWCLPLDSALYVVSGPGEQAAPGLADAAVATVTLRGDHGGRIVTWPAQVTRVPPGSAQWAAVAPQLAGKRLNAPGPTEALVARWAAECVIHRLAPAGPPVAAGATLPDGSAAEPPRGSPAARPARRPVRLHRVRRPVQR
ncbi:MAG TPA: hypothetical protein VNV66_15735 [Pilimelia sp.]|nr:hypothetical protein [Pilimelia sp.]